MNKRFFAGTCLVILVTLFNATAQQSGRVFDTQVPGEPNKEFQFLAFYINQGVTSNFFPQNDFLRGQVLGRMFGRNSVMTNDTATNGYIEQRLIPFFIYQPHLFDGKAILRAVFEIDWTWGDVSYGAGPNQGGAVSGHQVNIQTQNIELELIPKTGWQINIGLQRMFDNPYNPYRTLADKMLENGYRMTYFGTHSTGVTLYRNADFHRFKVGFFKFYENEIFRDDDVNMFEFQYEANINKLWRAALTSHYVRDRGNGRGGVSILGQGLNSQLTEYNGVFKFRFGSAPYEADIVWLGTHFSRNADYMIDRFFLNGFFNYNLGVVNVLRTAGWRKGAEIGGFAANLRAGYRYGQTIQDRITLDLMYTTGDENGIDDNRYTGVITGNSWAAPGGFFINSGALLLFPHGNVVNRFTPVIADLSNIGYGFFGGTANFSKGIVPYRLHAKTVVAAAISNATPIGGGRNMGFEVNGGLVYNLGPFMSIELHGGHLWLGNFFDSADDRYGFAVNGGTTGTRPVNPWTAFLVYKWLLF